MDKKIILTFLLIILAGQVLPGRAVSSQALDQWSPVRRIPNYNLTDRAPYMVADQNRTVHAFNNGNISSVLGAIYYRRWSPEQGWTPPVDIFVQPLESGLQTIQGIFLDQSGVLHLTYANILDTGGEIYYTQALASIADRATSWSTPVEIAADAGPLAFGTLTGDGKGKLLALFGAEGNGTGLYESHSMDGGNTWSNPRILSILYPRNQWPAAIRSDFDHEGNLHVVWGIVNELGVGDEVRYARLDANFETWSNETVLSRREGNDYSSTWPSIIFKDGTLIVIYQDSFPATRWMRLSTDGGLTWSLAARPFEYIGEYEHAVLLKDGSGNVHMVLGNRTGNPATHGMWYTRWMGRNWTPLVAITSGPNTSTYDPSAPQAVMVQGNIILATWWHNVRRESLSGAWYSYISLNIPELPRVTLSTPTITSASLTAEPTGAKATQRPISSTPLFATKEETPGNPGLPVFFSLIPVVILIPVIIILNKRRPPKR